MVRITGIILFYYLFILENFYYFKYFISIKFQGLLRLARQVTWIMQAVEQLLLPQLIAGGWWPLLWSGLKAHKPLKEMSSFLLHRGFPTFPPTQSVFPVAFHFHTTSQPHCRGKVSSGVLVARSCCAGFRCHCLQSGISAEWMSPYLQENRCLDLTPAGHTLVHQVSFNMVPKLLLLWSSFAIIRPLCTQTPGGRGLTSIWGLFQLPGKETH